MTGLALSALAAACADSPRAPVARFNVPPPAERVEAVPPADFAFTRVATTSARVPPPPSSRGVVAAAVLVGVDRAPGARPLEGAVNDVVNLRDSLVTLGVPADAIVVLRNEKAAKRELLAAIDRLAEAPADARVVFAFAGHTRRSHGQARLVTGDGSLLAGTELAAALGRVRAALWAAFPTCYAAALALPGIVGPNRVVTFAAAADQLAMEWQGQSSMFRYMVSEGLLERHAAAPTVESAYAYAADKLVQEDATQRPSIDDRYPGDFAIGRGAWEDVAAPTEQPRVVPAPSPAGPAPTDPPADPPADPPDGGGYTCGTLVNVGTCRT